ncbi:sulfatase-like hydrolase/transferase [bacterium]|nr:sulfatase-like hydrolase/transferase [candidate division CSSED10-310 bacterium]
MKADTKLTISFLKHSVAGLLCGLGFFILDLVLVYLQAPMPYIYAILPSSFILFLGLGSFFGLLAGIIDRIIIKVQSISHRPDGEKFIYTALYILILVYPLWLFGTHLFSGSGISKTVWAPYGPGIVTLIGCLFLGFGFTGFSFLTKTALQRKTTFVFSGIFFVFFLSGILIIYADMKFYTRYYGYIHNVLWGLAFYIFYRLTLVVCAVTATSSPNASPRKKKSILYSVLLLAMIASIGPAASNIGSSNSVRLWMLRNRSFLSRIMLPVIEFRWIEVPHIPVRIMENSPSSDLERVQSAAVQSIRQQCRHANILLITIDALRYDAVTPTNMPSLYAMSRRSVIFDKAFAHGSSTSSSVPVMITGQLKPGAQDALLSSYLAREGYATACILQKSSFQYVLYKIGIDLTKDFHNPLIFADFKDKADVSLWGWGVGSLTSSSLTDLAETLLTQKPHQPFFLWIHYFDLHQWSSITPEEMKMITNDSALIRDRFNFQRYPAIAHYIDSQVGRLFSVIDSEGLTDRTVIVVTSDHGEGLGDKGISHHTNYTYEELVHVPLFMSILGGAPVCIQKPVGLADITPTLLDLVLDNADGKFYGVSLLPYIAGEPDLLSHPPIWINDGGEQIAVIDKEWKLIFSHRYGTIERYNIYDDPSETDNRFGSDNSIDERLLKTASDYYSWVYDF